MPSEHVYTSVVVPVYNRADQLLQLLSSLGTMTISPKQFEVIVCDDGSTEDLLGVIEEAKKNFNLNIVFLRQDNRGPGAARNMGLKVAKGEITAFTDSDCEVDPGWLEGLAQAFDRTEVGLVGGVLKPHAQSSIVSQCSNWIMSSALAGGARDPRSCISMQYYPRTNNLAVRTENARRCGGFPNTRYGEDIEFVNRVKSLGFKAVFSDKAVAYHNEQKSLLRIFIEAMKKGRARTTLLRKRKIEIIHAIPAIFVVYLFVLSITAIVSWHIAIFAVLPLVAYIIINLIIGIWAACSLLLPMAFFVTPWCAFLMHVGYGVGFLNGLVAKSKYPYSK